MAATPVNRSTMNEVAVCQATVRRATSGSCRASQAIFGPIDWLESGIPVAAPDGRRPMRCSSRDLVRRPRIDAVQDPRPQRPAVPVHRHEARATGRHRDRTNPCRVADRLDQLAKKGDRVAPPDCLRVVLHPAGCRTVDLVRPRRLSDHGPIQQAGDALGPLVPMSTPRTTGPGVRSRLIPRSGRRPPRPGRRFGDRNEHVHPWPSVVGEGRGRVGGPDGRSPHPSAGQESQRPRLAPPPRRPPESGRRDPGREHHPGPADGRADRRAALGDLVGRPGPWVGTWVLYRSGSTAANSWAAARIASSTAGPSGTPGHLDEALEDGHEAQLAARRDEVADQDAPRLDRVLRPPDDEELEPGRPRLDERIGQRRSIELAPLERAPGACVKRSTATMSPHVGATASAATIGPRP